MITLAFVRSRLQEERPDRTDCQEGPIRFLARIMVRVLPKLSDVGREGNLDAFLNMTPVALVLRHQGLIRHALDAPDLAEALGLEQSTVRTYRSLAGGFLWEVEDKYSSRRTYRLSRLASWDQLIQQARNHPDGPDRHQISALGKLADFCSARQVEVGEVTTPVAQAYRAWLVDESHLRIPEKYFYQTRDGWHTLARIGLVHSVVFPPPDIPSKFGLRPEEISGLVAAVFEKYAQMATSSDPDERIGKSAISQSTLHRYGEGYRDYLGYLRNVAGEDLERMAVSEIFGRENLEGFHRFAIGRANGKAMSWHIRRMFFLRQLIDRVVTPHFGAVDTAWMSDLFRKTTPEEGDQERHGYSREIVEQVLDYLSARIAEAENREFSFKTLVPMYSAQFLIRFLLDHPLRRVNLPRSYLGAEFTVDGEAFRLRTKNGQVLREDLSEDALRAFQAYLGVRRRAGIDSRAMLVTWQGGAMGYGNMSNLVVNWFVRGAGIHFPPHCFRYLAVDEALSVSGGDPVYAAAAIGDRSGRVVERSYNRFQAEQGAQAWHALRRAFREDLPEALPPAVQALLRRAQGDEVLRTMIQDVIAREESDEQREAR